ncbi:MAG TPA: ABC transporter permease [Caldisericia bacterium]|nr:ABC transporter permease [Caldisericia bacterium]HQN48856.1 ABC transporter permease [Caldisericia bacterium]HQP00581.1 ABC transporter permease [Caldisericia bacterium]
MGIIKKFLNDFKSSFYLGWKIESNWTDPLLFLIYSLAKPLSSAFILIFMYIIISQGQMNEMLPHLIIGNALHLYTANVLFGMAWTVIDDREFYETLKYVYISPVSMFQFLAGRGFAKYLITTISSFIIIIFGFIFLNVRFTPIASWYIYFPIFLFIGSISLFIIGYFFAGINFLISRQGSFLTQSAAGVFLLLTGAIFPIDTFPGFLGKVGIYIPQTIWIDGMRKILLGEGWNSFFINISINRMLSMLIIENLIYFVIIFLFFNFSLKIARQRGLIDQRTMG